MKYQIGHVLKQQAKGHEFTYTLTSTYKHVNRRGFAVDVLVWTGNCATCGCSFEATTSAGSDRQVARNCPAHRRKTAAKQHQTSSEASDPETCGKHAVDMRRMSRGPHPGD